MTPSAVLDKHMLPLCGEIEAGYPVFKREFARLRPEHFVEWPDRDAYSGGWVVFPLVLALDPVPPMFDLERNRRLCPESFRMLARHSRIKVAGVSRLLPGCRVLPHEDRPLPGVVRFHLGLHVEGGAGLRFDDVEIETREGESYVFDLSMAHSAHNAGEGFRDILLVDFEVTVDEAAALARQRGAVNLGPTCR